MVQLKDKVFIVTGAGHLPGIGSQIAIDLLAHGANVIVNSRTFDDYWLNNKSNNLKLVKGDITSIEIQQAVIDCALSFNGTISGIINNASLTSSAEYDNNGLITRDCWNANFLINVITVYELAKKAKPYIKNGSILNISSRAAIQERVGKNLAYVVTKSAMVKLTKALALDFGPNANVNAICPGLTQTERWYKVVGNSKDEMIANWNAKSVMNSTVQPADVSKLALELLSNRMVTGQIIPICGGSSL